MSCMMLREALENHKPLHTRRRYRNSRVTKTNVMEFSGHCHPRRLPEGFEAHCFCWPADNSRRAFYKEFVKVVEAADVVIEVLDARDPLGCRCLDVERLVRKSGADKKVILLLNKIGKTSYLIPQEICMPWSFSPVSSSTLPLWSVLPVTLVRKVLASILGQPAMAHMIAHC